jgi:hypothetical protein
MANAPLTLNVAAGIEPGRTETLEIHQDAGDGYGYRLSEWRTVRVVHTPGSLKLTRIGDFNGQRIRYVEAFGLAAEPREIRADGRKVDHTFDAATKRVRVEIPDDAKEVTLMR